MEKASGLQRFILSQENTYATALAEIKQGRKKSHWMWFIFPQLTGLGFSEMAKRYAISDLPEAVAYLSHYLLGPRLVEISTELLKINTDDPFTIFGHPDDQKLKSSMTLFESAAGDQHIFSAVLNKFFDGRRDEKTLSLLKQQL